jgi:glucokinase
LEQTNTVMQAIGVDIGGTKIAFALVDKQGRVLAEHRLPTLAEEGAEAVFTRVAQGIHHLLTQTNGEVAGVGIGSPGHINPSTGVVHNATNLFWRDVPLLAGIRERLECDLRLWLEKDSNAGALGEMYFGAAQGCRDFVYLAVGTGLGGGALVDGELVQGSQYMAMEIGHMPFKPGGRLCRCGMHGCPEMYTSGVGLLAGVQEHLHDFPDSPLARAAELTTEAILDAARAKDALALAVMDEAVEWLVSVMIACRGVLNPALFVVGGGLGHAGIEWFVQDAQQQLHRRLTPDIHQNIQVVPSQVASSAVGAACLVWHGIRLNHRDTK